jgi:hypothetical protein
MPTEACPPSGQAVGVAAPKPNRLLQVGLIFGGVSMVFCCFLMMMMVVYAPETKLSLDRGFTRYRPGDTLPGTPWLRGAFALLTAATIVAAFNLKLLVSREKRAIGAAKLCCMLQGLAGLMIFMGLGFKLDGPFCAIPLLAHAAIWHLIYDESRGVKTLLDR